MYKFKNTIFALLASGALLTSCNDIDSNDRFIDLPPIESDRVVLLEDYTGQNCTNCPDAHAVMEQLQEQYPGQVVCVSIHAGEFAIPVDYPLYTGLKQPFGDEMGSRRGVENYPSGVIDGSGPALHTDWAAYVRAARSKPALCEVTVDGFAYDADTRTLTGNVTLLPGVSGGANLGIWLLESNIVARQTNHGKIDRKYVHNHVMRAHISGSIWGDPVTLLRDEESVHEFSITLDPTWNAGNVSVAAFVTDAATGEYLQSAIAEVTGK